MLYFAHFQSTLHTTNTEGEHDTITHTGKARVAWRDNGTWSLRYDDTDNKGQTSLQGADTWMSITREGEIRSHLLFRREQRLAAVYKTPQGNFDLETQTKDFAFTVDEQGGTVTLHYDLWIGGILATHNRLTLTWTRIATKQ